MNPWEPDPDPVWHGIAAYVGVVAAFIAAVWLIQLASRLVG